MANFKSQSSNPKAQVALLVGTLILLGAVAWGIGWVAHGLFDQRTAPSASTAEPTVEAPTLPPLTATSVRSTVPHPTSTLRPTSTPAPTLAANPTAEIEIVQHGEGVYQVCRRHCPGRWPDDDVPPNLEEYAREVARMNDLRWGVAGPRLHEGQVLLMPSCPQGR